MFSAGQHCSERELRWLQTIEYVLRAEETLQARVAQGILSPEQAYDLVLAVTDDEELALNTKVRFYLNSMPPPSIPGR